LQDFDMWLHLVQEAEIRTLQDSCFQYRVRLDGSNLSLSQKNQNRVSFELGVVYRRFFDGIEAEFFRRAFKDHLRNAQFTGTHEMEFEKAFLYQKMQHPAIYSLGLEKLYSLMSAPETRVIGEKNYGLSMRAVWEQALLPIYNDASKFQETNSEYERMQTELSLAKEQLNQMKSTMDAITSGKFWKLREKVYTLLRGSR